jgi:hypothetical protein
MSHNVRQRHCVHLIKEWQVLKLSHPLFCLIGRTKKEMLKIVVSSKPERTRFGPVVTAGQKQLRSGGRMIGHIKSIVSGRGFDFLKLKPGASCFFTPIIVAMPRPSRHQQ